ncbi:MAG: HRDC domain-containing protein [Bacteroidales bacterium]
MTETNPQLELAQHFIHYTGVNLFLTGKAGTGKTTFLRNLRLHSPKRMIVLAPTGVAAINAGGVTIHSFFQLPFAPYLPGTQSSMNGGGKQLENKFSREKINIMRSLDLLVIDEISMVRSDLLDAVDMILRKYKNRYKPFGGVQLLLIGDVQQLAPVVRDEDWSMLSQYYQSPYFFHSHALMESNYVTIELKKIYRQSDPTFVNILNAIRENRLDDRTLSILNKRYMPDFNPEEEDGYITLTTHNYQAQAINQRKMDELPGKSFSFKAIIEGNFPEYSYPTDETLLLKKGAQVMFVKNDPTPEKRFFNGKIGRIKAISAACIIVECDDQTITVEQQEWTNAKYTIHPDTQEIVETIEGKFKQYPLKSAWAITIHKSQGLTFDRAVINAGAAFSHGQVYVALSRCRSLEGLVLTSPIRASVIVSDQTVESFTKYTEEHQPDETLLANAREHYFLELVGELFDYRPIMNRLQHLARIFDEYLSKLYPERLVKYKEALLETDQHLAQVGIRFRNQLALLSREWKDFEENEVIQERIRKGVTYFTDHTSRILIPLIQDGLPETDNKEIASQLDKEFTQLAEAVQLKQATLDASAQGFSIKNYLDKKAKASIQNAKPKKSGSASKVQKVEVSSDIQNPGLYVKLRNWRRDMADELNVPAYTIFHQKALLGLANRMPTNKTELLSIPGVGKKIVENFGVKIIELIDEYRADEGHTLL